MSLLANKYVAGALSGLLAAAVVDISAFRSWKNVEDALAFNWKTAAFRWLQGAISGVLIAAGLGSMDA